MDPTIPTNTVQISKKKEWYLQHRNDETYKECMKKSRTKYYYANLENERQKALERYYRRKMQVSIVPAQTAALENPTN